MLKRYVVLLVIGLGLTFCEDTIFDLAGAGDLTAVKEKIKSDGFDPNATGFSKETVLHYAALSGNLKLVQYLVKNGAELEATNRLGTTVLDVAADYGLEEMVQYLVGKGADQTHKNPRKNDTKLDKTLFHR